MTYQQIKLPDDVVANLSSFLDPRDVSSLLRTGRSAGVENAMIKVVKGRTWDQSHTKITSQMTHTAPLQTKSRAMHEEAEAQHTC